MTLTEFLLARIEEDETAAQDAEPGPWTLDRESLPQAIIGADGDPVIRAAKGERDWTFQTSEVAYHVVRHDPARVLTECEAKRRIVDYREQCERDRDEAPREARDLFAARLLAFDATLRALALPYAGHPDYDEAWRP
ncbi:DUF6221 family protein [Cellulosimicrobium sp. XJ-DQ-B-000]|uniref:DUF6221 family protein n=1 Tax=Cellulosimicrobium sp. XJ-DQ-B-000 TaxID=3072182 RepID=UPI00280843FB|nr:DUF6221 family protein [Cellulosimicrobium sp. XJ-DQ-B-000]MDQ8040481.1 DUF6221 family protein [Cellulosimicrobium sp. XJ-DQ-B-000]